MLPNTPASRRDAIRGAVKTLVSQAISPLTAIPVVTSRLEKASVAQYIAIYLRRGERQQHYGGHDSHTELVIRLSVATDPLPDDSTLDLMASYIEAALSADSTLNGTVSHSTLSGFSYLLSPSKAYSTLQLKYTLKYND